MSADPPGGPETGDASPGIALRHMALTQSPAERGARPSAQAPHCFAVVLDWNLEGAADGERLTASIYAGHDGSASLYTTGSFGIVGGEGHDGIREAARRAVEGSQGQWAEARSVLEYPYPEGTAFHAYLIGFDGVRRLTGDFEELCEAEERHPLFGLFDAMQQVLTLLREAHG